MSPGSQTEHETPSLPLGQWFAGNVTTRNTTTAERRELRESLTFPIEIPDTDLTNETLSLAMDVGMYVGEAARKAVPASEWQQVTKGSKKFADYGQMLLVGLGGYTPLNPVRIMLNVAYGVASGETDTRLLDIYDRWTNHTKRRARTNK